MPIYTRSGPECLAALQAIPLFAGLGLPAITLLATAVTFSKREVGEHIIGQGELGESLYIILSGEVEVVRENELGKSLRLARLGAGEYFGEMSLIDDKPRSASVDTLEKVELMHIAKAGFEDLMAAEPGITREILRGMSRRLRAANALIGDLSDLGAFGRVANLLLQRAQAAGGEEGGGCKIALPLDHAEIASEVELDVYTVDRIMADLTEGGFICRKSGSLMIGKQSCQ